MSLMSSRPTKNKQSRCKHDSTTVCGPCRREHHDLQQVGAWARTSTSSRNEPYDDESFLRNNPEALSTERKQPANPTRSSTKDQPANKQPSKYKTPETKSKSSHKTDSKAPAPKTKATTSIITATQRYTATNAAQAPLSSTPASRNIRTMMSPETARLAALRQLRGRVESESDESSSETASEDSEDEDEDRRYA